MNSNDNVMDTDAFTNIRSISYHFDNDMMDITFNNPVCVIEDCKGRHVVTTDMGNICIINPSWVYIDIDKR